MPQHTWTTDANLLNHLAASSCSRLGSHWDRCGVHYVEPIEGPGYTEERRLTDQRSSRQRGSVMPY
jgi:hypothetical protein